MNPSTPSLFIPELVPESWRRLADDVLCANRSLFLLGGTDVGKSTLARYLLRASLERGLLVAFLDADVGQSVVGPPTTIGLKRLCRSLDELTETPDALYFVGDVTPASALTEVVVGTRRLADVARERGAELLIADTTGLVGGLLGYRLKTSKIECLRPTDLIAIEESETSDALRAILSAFSDRTDIRIHRLVRIEGTSAKTVANRSLYRRDRFTDYFADAREVVLRFGDVTLSGTPLLREGVSPDDIAGSLVAFLGDRGLTTRLGVLRELDTERGFVRVFAPSGCFEGSVHLRLSDYRLLPGLAVCGERSESMKRR